MAKKKILYSEPAGYFPEEIRKKFGLGEYAVQNKEKSVKNDSDKSTEKSDNRQ
ncbi:MAG: hypothetical protein IK085_00240 [Clostridia bacterium]|nr:hypothetical protein [Clostridia bacterium]